MAERPDRDTWPDDYGGAIRWVQEWRDYADHLEAQAAMYERLGRLDGRLLTGTTLAAHELQAQVARYREALERIAQRDLRGLTAEDIAAAALAAAGVTDPVQPVDPV